MARYIENITVKNGFKQEFSKYTNEQLQTHKTLYEDQLKWHLTKMQDNLRDARNDTSSLNVYLLCGQADDLLDCQLKISAIDILLEERRKVSDSSRPSSLCASDKGASVVTVQIWVCPLVNIAEPWTLGRRSTSAARGLI